MNKFKEVFDFIKWQVRKWRWHDYLWMSACFMVSFDFEKKGTVFMIGMSIGLIMFLGMLVKWQWDSWKRERNDLLQSIKDGK
jgi:hypothetical protein